MDFNKLIQSALSIIGIQPDVQAQAPTNTPDVNNKQVMQAALQQRYPYAVAQSPEDVARHAQAISDYMKSNNAPVGQFANDFANEANKYDITRQYPYLVPAISMNETSGGKNVTFPNNDTNWGIKEPTFKPTSHQQVIERTTSGIGERAPFYQDFRDTGDLSKFAAHYAPPGENNTKKYVQDLLD